MGLTLTAPAFARCKISANNVMWSEEKAEEVEERERGSSVNQVVDRQTILEQVVAAGEADTIHMGRPVGDRYVLCHATSELCMFRVMCV